MIVKIKEFRIAHGLSQEELAKRVGVRRETMVFLEKGKYNPSLRLAYRTAKVLKTTIDELFSFDDEEWTEDLNRET
jgi:putative transcriptional regulator